MSKKDSAKEVASKSSRKSNSKIRLIFLKIVKHSLLWCCCDACLKYIYLFLVKVNRNPRKSWLLRRQMRTLTLIRALKTIQQQCEVCYVFFINKKGRFVQIKRAEQRQPELWLQDYPVDLLIHTVFWSGNFSQGPVLHAIAPYHCMSICMYVCLYSLTLMLAYFITEAKGRGKRAKTNVTSGKEVGNYLNYAAWD